MLRVLGLGFVVGLLGAAAGMAVINVTNAFHELREGAAFVPLIAGAAGSIVGAVAGATDAILQAIREGHPKDDRS